jgi:hypothetical protein
MMRHSVTGKFRGHVSTGGGAVVCTSVVACSAGPGWPRGKGGRRPVRRGRSHGAPAPVNRKSSFDDAAMGRGPAGGETRRAGQPRECAGNRTLALAGRPVSSTVVAAQG